MLIELKVPGSVVDATILVWHKRPDDRVEMGESVLDVETAKGAVEVEAPQGGTIKEILKQQGEVISSDDAVCTIETS